MARETRLAEQAPIFPDPLRVDQLLAIRVSPARPIND